MQKDKCSSFKMNLHLIALVACSIAGSYAQTPLHIAPDSSSRIIGGKDPADDAHPYVVSLRYKENHKCAGSILNEKYIVTAAHCVYGEDKNVEKFKVAAGTNTLTAPADITVEEITYHEDYSPLSLLNDIAILKVTGMTTDKIEKILVEEEAVGEIDVTLAGWRSIKVGSDFSDKLRDISLKTITEKACQDVYGNSKVTYNQICTSTEANTKGICYGDSGSPLVREVEEQGVNVKRLVGIASWGTPCARGKPDVFTRVSSYLEWINTICEDCLKPIPPVEPK